MTSGAGTNLLLGPPETALTNFITVVVYTVASLVELATPAVPLLVEATPQSATSLSDQDPTLETQEAP